jgi:hypothetical protein
MTSLHQRLRDDAEARLRHQRDLEARAVADAARAMLAALRVAENTAAELCNDQHPENECWNSLATIRAAIAQAEAAGITPPSAGRKPQPAG